MPERISIRAEKKNRRKKRISNTLVFVLVFVAFVLVFGILLLWFLVQYKANQGSTPDSVTSDVSQARFDERDVRTVLVVMADNRDIWGAVLIYSDPAGKAVRTMGLPPDTQLSYGTEGIRLDDLYRQQDKGIQAVRDAVQSLCGFDIGYYVVVGQNHIEKILDYLETGLVYNLPEAVTVDRGGQQQRYPAGTQTLITRQVLDILGHSGWSRGPRQRAQVQAELVAALVNQYLVTLRTDGDRDFNNIVGNTMAYNILFPDFQGAKSGLSWLAQNNKGSICAAVDAPGGYTGSGDRLRFEPDDDFADKLQVLLGRNQ